VQDREFGRQFRLESLSSKARRRARRGYENYRRGMVKGPGPACTRASSSRTIARGLGHSSRIPSAVRGGGGQSAPRESGASRTLGEKKSHPHKSWCSLHHERVSNQRAVGFYKTYGEGAPMKTVQMIPTEMAPEIHGIAVRHRRPDCGRKMASRVSLLLAVPGWNNIRWRRTGKGIARLPVEA